VSLVYVASRGVQHQSTPIDVAAWRPLRLDHNGEIALANMVEGTMSYDKAGLLDYTAAGRTT